MKATQQGVANSLAFQSITSPTAANNTTTIGSSTPAANSAPTASGSTASAQLTIGHYIFGRSSRSLLCIL